MSRLRVQALANLMQTLTPFHAPTTTKGTSLCLCGGFWGFMGNAGCCSRPQTPPASEMRGRERSFALQPLNLAQLRSEGDRVWGLRWLPNATHLWDTAQGHALAHHGQAAPSSTAAREETKSPFCDARMKEAFYKDFRACSPSGLYGFPDRPNDFKIFPLN